jgi:molecular chaperone HscC
VKTIVGIDLGTTFSLVAAMQAGRPVILPNALGETLTPSAVSVTDDGTVLVGAPARARATTHPTATALAFKRDMGTPRTHTLAGREMTPQALSALVLASLRRDAEAALGRKVDEAVVTVPAYFGDAQRQATRDAAEIAGLHVERIINEPTAAALAYGLHERSREMRAVVLDLGGGTFDVTVLEIIEGVVEIQSSAGDARLGGEDFDAALAELVASRVERGRGVDVRADPVARARVRDASELAKKRLSDAESARVVLVDAPLGGGRSFTIEETLTRADAEAAWGPLLERIRAPILRALRDVSIAPAAIDEVLLVGGSSRMPCVGRLAAQIFGRLPLRALPPDEAIAMGAAVQAALKSNDASVEDMVVTDVAPFTLGIAAVADFGGARASGLFAPILERGTVNPASREKQFFTVESGQRKIKLEVFQGEHSLCADNTKLCDLEVPGIPVGPAGSEAIDVRFTYDLNGILEVEARVQSTGKTVETVLERGARTMSRQQIDDARKAMRGLKIHPREALPNATALARADALYVELSGELRQRLGLAISAFRAALVAQEPKAIDGMREQLTALVAALRSIER